MSTTNGNEIIELRKYSGEEDISSGTVGFPFYCFDTDYGSNGNMLWNPLQMLRLNFLDSKFGSRFEWLVWFNCSTTITRSAFTFDAYTSNHHSIKRFISSQTSYLESNIFDVNMEIRLIRGIFYQYIEVNMIYNQSIYEERIKGGYAYSYWFMKNNGKEYPVFAPKDNPTKTKFLSPPVNSGGSFVLRSDLNGNNWELFKNYYVKL
jgi:hypothetical protein